MTRAEFGGTNGGSSAGDRNTSSNGTSSTANTVVASTSTNTSSSGAEKKEAELAAICAMLPKESEAGAYPVTLIMNAFDPSKAQAEDDTGFFDELEVREVFKLS